MDRYYSTLNDQGKFCIYDSQGENEKELVGQVSTKDPAIANDMAQNITCLLNFKQPVNPIVIEGRPRWLLTHDPKAGFKIRNGMGEANTVCTFALEDKYNHLKDYITPNFMTALCDFMTDPSVQKQTPDRPRKPRSPS